MSRRAISLATGVPEAGFGRLAWAAGGAAGVQILGIRTAAGVFTVGEPSDQLLHEGDAVLVLTTHDGIDELEEHWSRVI